MPAFRSAALAFTALAAALAVPAAASRSGEVPLGEALAAYQKVCVANPGDSEAQIDAIKTLPGTYDELEPTSDGTRNFDNGRVLVRVLDDDKAMFCGAASYVSTDITLDDLKVLGTAQYGKPDEMADRRVSWMRKSGSTNVIHVFLLSERDQGPEAAFLMGIMK